MVATRRRSTKRRSVKKTVKTPVVDTEPEMESSTPVVAPIPLKKVEQEEKQNSFAFNQFRQVVPDDIHEQPRQILFLSFILLPLLYFAFMREEATSLDVETAVENIKTSAAMMSFAFLIYISLQLKDTIMVRPHPIVWRLVHGVLVLYFLVICGIMVQSVHHARQFLSVFFDDVKEADHDTDWNMRQCEINYKNLHRQFTSWWCFSHFFGWFGKMLMLRNWKVAMVQSVLFEFIELSLQFLIADFGECWWDSIMLDMFGANIGGMFFGWIALKVLGCKFYDWEGDPECPNPGVVGATEGLLHHLNPMTYIRWSRPDTQCAIFRKLGRFMTYFITICIPIQFELNVFLLMYTMWVPVGNIVVRLRVLLVLLLALPAFQEWYQFCTNPKCYRIGQNSWIAIAIVVVECLIVFKFGREQFNFIPPPEIYLPWGSWFIMFIIWFICNFWIYPMKDNETIGKTGNPPMYRKCLDVLFYVSFLPFLTLTQLWHFT